MQLENFTIDGHLPEYAGQIRAFDVVSVSELQDNASSGGGRGGLGSKGTHYTHIHSWLIRHTPSKQVTPAAGVAAVVGVLTAGGSNYNLNMYPPYHHIPWIPIYRFLGGKLHCSKDIVNVYQGLSIYAITFEMRKLPTAAAVIPQIYSGRLVLIHGILSLMAHGNRVNSSV